MGLLARVFRKQPEDQLREVLGDFKLPSFPAVVVKARAVIRDDDASNSDIADCIVQDPGLSVRVLKTVNSAAYGLQHRVDSVEQSVALLGRAQVESLLLSHGVGAALPPMRARQSTQFWGAAARRATVAKALAERLHPLTGAQSFTGSLLQDMAVPVLIHVLRDRYDELLSNAVDGPDLAAHEREEFGWDHAEVGSWMCQSWAFPDTLTACVADHHAEDTSEIVTPVAVRAVALLPDVAFAGDTDPLIAFVEEEYGLDGDEICSIVEAADRDGEELARLFR